MSTLTQHGYLVLADISGYTAYLSQVELDHAHEILTDLLTAIVSRLKTLLTISKLEGDAVLPISMTYQLQTSEATGARLRRFLDGESSAPGPLKRPVFKLFMPRVFPMHKLMEKMGQCIAEAVQTKPNEMAANEVAA